MVKPLREVIEDIIESGGFDNCIQDEGAIRAQMEVLFSIYKKGKKQFAARSVYSGIIDIARLGKRDLAYEFVRRFEEEIGYDLM
jgi:hypothetical protein